MLSPWKQLGAVWPRSTQQQHRAFPGQVVGSGSCVGSVGQTVPVGQAESQGVVAAMLDVRPGGDFTARRPLTGLPPTTNFDWAPRIRQVENHHDIAEVTLDGRRDVRVTTIEVETMNAHAGGFPVADQPWLRRPGHVVDPEPT